MRTYKDIKISMTTELLSKDFQRRVVDMRRIHQLMDLIENKTGKMFHETFIQEFEDYKQVCEDTKKPSGFILKLTRIFDDLNK